MLTKNEVIYEDLDGLQPNVVMTIKRKECTDYGKSPRGADIKLEDCPAYVEQKRKDKSIRLEECPAYGVIKGMF